MNISVHQRNLKFKNLYIYISQDLILENYFIIYKEKICISKILRYIKKSPILFEIKTVIPNKLLKLSNRIILIYLFKFTINLFKLQSNYFNFLFKLAFENEIACI